jgi:hypothetical protein
MFQDNLETLHLQSAKLYLNYRSGLLSLDEYLEKIKPLDRAIDQFELIYLSCHLQDTPVSEKASLKLSR